MPLIPALGRQKQVYLGEFKASLVYKDRTAKIVIQRNHVSKKQKQKKKKIKEERRGGRRRGGGGEENIFIK